MLLVRALFLTLLAVTALAFTAFAEKLNQRPEFNYLGTAIVDVCTKGQEISKAIFLETSFPKK